ncbi:disease resistance protein RGA3 [Pyrus ussuriensis x Pyrus communis]|uniref:Disease resistance protein RGA3 n=1 Tax=Pyrus ussuriensis x Pyrus communis TaxID=2448454 RepID=A0A5N5HFI9_9ROSA|nr:disease resistance protein RGA3 [Pyrus ussuriensis x Pyrus communis]
MDQAKIEELPSSIGKLKCLRARRHRIDELGRLNHLEGKLIIGSLEYVRDKDEAKKSNLVGKANIQRLELRWNISWGISDNFHDHDLLESFQPTIQNFMGSKFASWIMSDSLPINLTEIKLNGCRECEEVSPLRHLPNLRTIVFDRMTKLKCVGVEFYGYKHVNNDAVAMKVTLFPALKSLRFENSPALSEWKEAVVEKVMSTGEKAAPVMFPCLEELKLWKCRNLKSAPTHFPSLREMAIWEVGNAMPIENICSRVTTLTSLDIYSIKELTCLPVGMGEKNHNLRELRIKDCDKLASMSCGLEYCTSLETLRVSGCPNLESFQISPSQSL